MTYKMNKDPNYFTKYAFISNCGSFAFNIREWYTPDENFEKDDEELGYELLVEEGMDEYSVLELLFNRNIEQIMEDFELKRVEDMDYSLKNNEELVAFRMCVDAYNFDEIITDYHFRVKRNGKWMEKCGDGPVQDVEDYNEDPWEISDELVYWGPIAYFVRKCA